METYSGRFDVISLLDGECLFLGLLHLYGYKCYRLSHMGSMYWIYISL